MVTIRSFGFRYNDMAILPSLIIDARILKNPAKNSELDKLRGTDKAVQDEISQSVGFKIFYSYWLQMASYVCSIRKNPTIMVGCYSGRHRAVFIAEKLAVDLHEMGYDLQVEHRDIWREP